MPPRIRSRVNKAQKENIGTRNKQKSTGITTKAPRRALADKTNSASDDNSFKVPSLSSEEKKTVIKSSKAQSKKKIDLKDARALRPRRDRRVPTRFEENAVLTSLNSTKDVIAQQIATANGAKASSTKITNANKKVSSPGKSFNSFESNSRSESSLIASRPKRIARLPSRFNDHSVSPSKFIPLQPQNASTPLPLPQSKIKAPVEKQSKKQDKTPKKQTPVPLQTRSAKTNAINKILNNEVSPDHS